MLRDVSPGPNASSPNSPMLVGSRLVFVATEPAHGVQPWQTDGTREGTELLRPHDEVGQEIGNAEDLHPAEIEGDIQIGHPLLELVPIEEERPVGAEKDDVGVGDRVEDEHVGEDRARYASRRSSDSR